MDCDGDCGFSEHSSNQLPLTTNFDDPRDIPSITKVLDVNIGKCIAELLESFDHLTRNMFKVSRNDKRRVTTKNHILPIDE